jgi:hypothetical protein
VVGEGAAPSRLANLAISGVYKTPLHGWCYPTGATYHDAESYYGVEVHDKIIARPRSRLFSAGVESML